jgi:hypothetical protein
MLNLNRGTSSSPQFFNNVEVHSVAITLFHDLSYFLVKFMDERSGRMVNDLREAFKADSTFSNISVEKSDTNNNV